MAQKCGWRFENNGLTRINTQSSLPVEHRHPARRYFLLRDTYVHTRRNVSVKSRHVFTEANTFGQIS